MEADRTEFEGSLDGLEELIDEAVKQDRRGHVFRVYLHTANRMAYFVQESRKRDRAFLLGSVHLCSVGEPERVESQPLITPSETITVQDTNKPEVQHTGTCSQIVEQMRQRAFQPISTLEYRQMVQNTAMVWNGTEVDTSTDEAFIESLINGGLLRELDNPSPHTP